MVIIVFGVSGAGKTLIGSRLASDLGWTFYDADLFHSAQNLVKMSRGIPLTDQDRAPWLDRVCAALQGSAARGDDAILACSGLKEAYRRRLLQCADARLVFLKGDFEIINERLSRRQGHFMNPALLLSQFETLEEPHDAALVVDVRQTPEEIVALIRKEFNL